MPNLLTAALLHDAFWAIEESAGNLLVQQLRVTDADRHRAEFSIRVANPKAFDEDALSDEASSGSKSWDMSDDIAILRLSGPMTKSPTSMDAGTSTVQLRRQLRLATADPDVKGIMLVIDSPGGSVSGTSDLGDDVAAASRKKLMTAYVEDMCCSAAYWTASQASGGIYSNATGMIGSIGTVMIAYDASRMYENAGVETLVFSTGKLKGAGAFGSKITDVQRASFQAMVDELNDHFVGAVARGRNMARSKVEQIADGGVHIGKAAQKLGLVDGISSMDDVLKSMKQRAAKGKGPSQENDFALKGPLPVGASLEQSLDAAHALVQDVTARVDRVRSLRAEQERRLSATRVDQVRGLYWSLGDLLKSCEAHSSTEEDAPAQADAAPESNPIDDETRAALQAAIDASESDLLQIRQAG